jgi:hypothetical protein
MIIPLLALLDQVRRTPPAQRVLPLGVWAWLAALAVLAGLWLPRQMIWVALSEADSGPAESLRRLLASPLSFWRDVNLLYTLVAYLLPTLALASVGRLVGAWRRLAPYRRMLLVYTGLVLLLALFGGTDLPRFMAYLVVPQTLLLGAMLDQDIHLLEVSLVLVLTALFNRVVVISLPSAPSMDFFLDFYGGYGDRVNLATLLRTGELIGYLVLVRLVRGRLARRAGRTPVSAT